MKKNGFTLIELLAVILILGVIALIAIPTVTSIIEDTKKQSYVRSAEGLLSSIETEVNINMLKGENIYKAYNFGNDKLLNDEIDLKGTLPKEGQVRINDDGEILMAIVYDQYCLTKSFEDEKITINELENSKCILPGTKNKLKNHAYWSNEISAYTYNKTEYMDDLYRDKIISINYLYSDIIPSNIVDGIVWDLSRAQDNSIKGYLLANGENYDLYIISENTIHYDINDCRIMYKYLSNLQSVNFYNFNTTGVWNFDRMFMDCHYITELDLTGFDTSSANSMYAMFESATKLEELNITNFDTSNVSGMASMFYTCRKLTNLDLSSFDTSKGYNMRRMFGGCDSLQELDLSNFDTKNVTNMSEMFTGLDVLTKLNITSFNTSKVTNMQGMFYDIPHLTELDLSSFNTSNVDSMVDMFRGTNRLTKIYISNKWIFKDTGETQVNVTNMCRNSGVRIDDNTCTLTLKN